MYALSTSVTTITLVTALGIPKGAQPHPGMVSGGIASLHPPLLDQSPADLT